MRIYIRNLLIISIRTCYRSISNHPFLVSMFWFLVFLYMSFPGVFYILVSASPVFVCAGVLLGTLLSIGRPDMPEVEKEKLTRGVSTFRAVLVDGTTGVAELSEPFGVRRYSENKSDAEEASLMGDEVGKVDVEHASLSYVPLQLFGETFGGKQPENLINETKKREFGEPDPKKHEENHDGGGSDDVSLDSGSDRLGSSSPDVSMADILPMHDELHPLLDSDDPKPAHASYDDSEHSHGTGESSIQSDEHNEEKKVELEEDGIDVNDYDDEDEDKEEEEEERHEGKEDDSKSAIKWTEDDQKSLMDLRSLELERNQRLEHLMARRLASKSMKMMTERNLIDLDFADNPFTVAHISTMRRNPFDSPYASNDSLGFLTIPGSVPSILQPRRNPFDIPHDTNEEKTDLERDSFEQEFMKRNQKEPLFTRHESFSMGPSCLWGPRHHERQDIKWMPIFSPERLSSEGTSDPAWQRQSSEMSIARVSSVRNIDSVSYADQDELKVVDRDSPSESDLISDVEHASDQLEHKHLQGGNVRHNEVEIILEGVENPSGTPDDNKDSGIAEVEDSHFQECRTTPESSAGNSGFMSGEVENNEPSEPVYDSSPTVPEKFLSFSSISSDTFEEITESGSPATSTETMPSAQEKESEQGNKQNPISYADEVNKVPSHMHVVHKNEPTSRDVDDKNQHANTETQISGTDHSTNDQSGPTGSDNVNGGDLSFDSRLVSSIRSTDETVAAFDGFDETKKSSSTSPETSQSVSVPNDIEPQPEDNNHSLEAKGGGSDQTAECKLELPVLEVRSHEDIDLAFKQMHEGADVKEVILPSSINDQLAFEQNKDDMKDKSRLHLVEARSIEDINVTLKQISANISGKQLKENDYDGLESKEGIERWGDPTESKQQLPVLQVRSHEEIYLAFKQMREGVDVKDVILPGSIKDQQVQEATKDGQTDKTHLHLIEARNIDDINAAVKQISERNPGRQPNENDYDELKSKEEGSSKLIESSDNEAGTEQHKTEHISEETSAATETKTSSENATPDTRRSWFWF